MVSQHVVDLCTATETVTTKLAKLPNSSIKHVAIKLFEKSSVASKVAGGHSRKASKESVGSVGDDFEDVLRCGKFTDRPSDLFLRIYGDVLGALHKNPLAGMVSPSLMASTGVIPLSIVSVIPDIMRHYADLIVRAKVEVFLATNYWEPSHGAALIAGALKELSKRNPGNGNKVIVKLMYDRGTASQIFKNHAVVPLEKWPSLHLPKPEEMPNVDLEVINFHRPVVGTFHAKYLIVDRRIVCLNSNNIQDRPNIEMMTHIEGPIVDSFYDMALLSWSNALHPPLPLLQHPPTYDQNTQYQFGPESENLRYINPQHRQASRDLLHKQVDAAEHDAGMDHRGKLSDVMFRGPPASGEDAGGYGEDELIGQHPEMTVPHSPQLESSEATGTPPSSPPGQIMIGENAADPQPRINTYPNEQPPDIRSHEPHPDAQSITTTSGLSECPSDFNTAESDSHSDLAQHSTSNLTANPVADSPKPTNIAENTNLTAELIDRSKSEGGKSYSTVASVAKHLNAGWQDTQATAEDDESMDDFNPHIIHAPHRPVPMAMVNRQPRGTPGHEDSGKIPQNLAFLGAFKHAQKSVFVQTPTFNAAPVVAACLEACIRGIECTLYIDLGFNDIGESIPFQGGTNEENVANMYAKLNAVGKAQFLKVYWYTGKDQLRPMNASLKKRNCHVKFLSVDGQVAIQGNGNQDTQSWFHSQEINLMIDSKDLVQEWHKGINANQNTFLFGLVDPKDGIWRDKEGNEVQASGVEKFGPIGRLKSLSSTVKKVTGGGKAAAPAAY